SLALAREGHDLEQACWAQLRLLGLVGDREGPQSASQLIAKLRRDVTQLGVPAITAALHLVVAEIGAKRGLVANAAHHLRVAQQIFAGSPNAWFECWTQNDFIG